MEPLGRNFSEILIAVHSFPLKKMNLKCRLEMVALLSRSQCVNRGKIPFTRQALTLALNLSPILGSDISPDNSK